MKSLKDFNYLLSLDRRYTKTESEIFRSMKSLEDFNYLLSLDRRYTKTESEIFRPMPAIWHHRFGILME